MKEEKLVRDRVPEIIRSKGECCCARVLPPEEYTKALDEKLVEEMQEFLNETDPSHRAEELADLMEVIFAEANLLGLSHSALNRIRKAKLTERGGFTRRLALRLACNKRGGTPCDYCRETSP